jgi:hypothetical protein
MADFVRRFGRLRIDPEHKACAARHGRCCVHVQRGDGGIHLARMILAATDVRLTAGVVPPRFFKPWRGPSRHSVRAGSPHHTHWVRAVPQKTTRNTRRTVAAAPPLRMA